jgi:ATP-binding cassette, subfamily B, bacterial
LTDTDTATPPTSRNFGPLKQLLRFLWPHKWRLIGASTALIFTAMAQLSLGYGVRLLIDEGFSGTDDSGLKQAVAFMMIVGCAMAIGAMIRFYLVTWLGERVSADLRSAAFKNLVRLQPSYFESNEAGEIMSRLTTDTTLLQSLIGSSVSMAARNALSLVGALTMMIITNFKLSLIILFVVPLTIVPIMIFGRRVRKLSNESQQSIAEVGSRAGEVLQAIKVVQSYNREGMEQRSFDRSVEVAFQVAKRRIRQRTILTGVAISLLLSGLVGMMWSGGQDVIQGRMSGGELGAFVFYAVILGSAFATLSEVWGDLQRAAGAAERLLELMGERSTTKDTGTSPAPMRQAIRFDDIQFAYPSRPSSLALNDFKLSVAPGQSLALVGPSGAGKSTVFELLQRFHDPAAGAVYYGDVDIRAISLTEWRDKAALVPQSPVLFSGDIRHNIAYGNPEASDDQIEAAARAAHADEFISQLPEGYKSQLGSQGVRLSGGQRQRLALARAILNDPEILLLDEATSALDTESEYYVQQALTEVMRDRTTIIIAHRLSTIINADVIAVMEKGRIIATGTHTELLESCPLYARLASLQFDERKLESQA